MRNIVLTICQSGTLAMAFTLMSAGAAEVQTNYGGFNVVLEAAQSTYPAGTPIILTVTVTNGTRERVLWDLPLAGCSCVFGYFEVKSLPTNTNLQCRWMDNFMRSGHDHIWQNPSESTTRRYDLTQRFGMSDPGTYEVRLLGRMPTPTVVDSKEPTVPTPPLIITITNVPTGTNVVPDATKPPKRT